MAIDGLRMPLIEVLWQEDQSPPVISQREANLRAHAFDRLHTLFMVGEPPPGEY